jgi:hypothetical protein
VSGPDRPPVSQWHTGRLPTDGRTIDGQRDTSHDAGMASARDFTPTYRRAV